MHKNQIHDGDRVRIRLNRLNRTNKTFAEQMNWSKSRVERSLKKEDWPTGDLAKAGEVLDFNFFTAYCPAKTSPLLGLLVSPEVLLNEEVLAAVNQDLEAGA